MPSHHRPRGDPARQSRGGDALDRRPDPSHQLPRGPQARAEGGAAAGEGRHQARRPRRDARLEHLAASGNLVRHHRHRRGLSHRQSAPVPGPDRLHRQSCRGPADVPRHDLRAADGEAAGQAADHPALRDPDRCGAHAADDAAQRGRLRGLDRRGRRRFHLGDVRRKYRRRHVLHLRHHRQSEGRRLLAPLQRAALADGADARRVRSLGAGHHHAGGAVLPRQRLDHRVLGADVGLPADPARHEARRRLDLRIARRRARHHDGRGADHLADAAQSHGDQQPQALDLAPRADRRLGLPARHDREVREELRRHGRACLGHDRDEPDRLDLRDQAGLRREGCREDPRREGEAGRGAVHRRDEDRRRCRQGACRGTARPSAASR